MKKRELKKLIREVLVEVIEADVQPILPVGKTDLKTGKNKTVSIYTTWEDDRIEIYKDAKNK